MVAIMLTGLIIIVAMAFFMFQTTHGREATTTRISREALSLAMLMLRQDIMHAGFGVADKPELAVYLSDKTADPAYKQAYTRLYVNAGSCLMDPFKRNAYDPLGVPSWSPPSVPPSLYCPPVPKPCWEIPLGPYDLGGLIADNAGAANRIATLTCANPSGPAPYSYSVTLGGGMTLTDNYAPVVSYTFENNALKRNGKVLLGDDPSDPTAPRDRTLRVTEFRVYAMFFTKVGGVQREVWVPSRPPGTDPSVQYNNDFNNMNAADLRLVEATIEYQLRTEAAIKTGDQESGWSPTKLVDERERSIFSKTIRVAPRTGTLAAY
jgi:hypothetical protein